MTCIVRKSQTSVMSRLISYYTFAFLNMFLLYVTSIKTYTEMYNFTSDVVNINATSSTVLLTSQTENQTQMVNGTFPDDKNNFKPAIQNKVKYFLGCCITIILS